MMNSDIFTVYSYTNMKTVTMKYKTVISLIKMRQNLRKTKTNDTRTLENRISIYIIPLCIIGYMKKIIVLNSKLNVFMG